MEIILNHKINYVNLISAGMICLGTSTLTQAAVVINEIDYDQPGSDIAEFIELYNSDTSAVSLDGYTLELINGTNGNAYNTFDLSGLSINANSYLVLCDNTSAVANCNLDIASAGWIQNGGADGDAVALLSGGMLIDSLAYEGIGSFLGTYAEGGNATIDDSNSIVISIARLPNGLDSNINASDFNSACLTPGSSNISGTGDCSVAVNPVPVPAAIWLFGSGLIGLIGISRRKQSLLRG